MESKNKITVSLGQMDVRIGDVAKNLATMKVMTAVAVEQGSDDIDLSLVSSVRRKIPVFEDRRPGLY